MSISSSIESILFVASVPLSFKKIAGALNVPKEEVQQAVEMLTVKYNTDDSGIHILLVDDTVQMATNSENSSVVDGFVKDEIAGELTKAQVETLTVIAYAGPITRPELEQIRGVNCAIILRNLLVRGLIIEQEESRELLPTYVVSVEALAHLGINRPEELPEYEVLHNHVHIQVARSGDGSVREPQVD